MLPTLLVVAIFSAGVWSISHLLQEVDLQQVAHMVRGTPPHIILVAMLCMLGSYLSMVGYDWSALRYLGKKIPLLSIVTGGFLGYAIGSNLGGGPVTGAAVRYRIYSALGLTLANIATVAAFGSFAFALGMTSLGTGALFLYPGALDGIATLSPVVIRILAGAAFVTCLTIVLTLAIRKSPFTWRKVSVRPPSAPLVGVQMLLTLIDFLLAATTLYLLIPHNDLGFIPFVAIFTAGIFVAVISHVPGGVGVFETVILAALPATVPLESAAAGLLLFRVIYYFTPFGMALSILALHEARGLKSHTFAALSPVLRAAASVIPLAISAMVFGIGVYMMIAPLVPSLSDLARRLDMLLPLVVLEGSALLLSAIGTTLVVIAHGLLRRVEGAWWLTLILLIGGLFASLAHGVDYQRFVIMLVAILILLPTRRQFFRTTRLTHDLLSWRWIAMLASLAIVSLSVLFFAHKATPFAHEMWWQFATDQQAPRALRATFVALVSLTAFLLVYSLRPGTISHAFPSQQTLARTAQIVAAQDDPNANIALTGDKYVLFSERGNAFLMYRIEGRTWVALHEPFGARDEFLDLAWRFHDLAQAANGRPVFYAVSPRSVPIWLELGLTVVKMGEAAIVDLKTFTLEGKNGKRLRTSHNRALRDGLSFDVLQPPIQPDVMARLQHISDDWLKTKAGSEKGFSVGVFDPVQLARFPIATVTYRGETVAFANIWQTGSNARAAVDLMRHVADAPSGLMEFLFTELILHFQANGYAEFSLGNAPLSGLEGRRARKLSARLGAFVYRHGGHFYNFEGLHSFKNKFSPRWDPVFVAFPPHANLVAVTKDITKLIGGGLRDAGRKPAKQT